MAARYCEAVSSSQARGHCRALVQHREAAELVLKEQVPDRNRRRHHQRCRLQGLPAEQIRAKGAKGQAKQEWRPQRGHCYRGVASTAADQDAGSGYGEARLHRLHRLQCY